MFTDQEAADVGATLQVVARYITEDAPACDAVTIFLLGAAPDRRALISIYVDCWAETDDSNSWFMDLPLYEWEGQRYFTYDHEGEQSKDALMAAVWDRFVVPWLADHGVAVDAYDNSAEFMGSTWR